VEAVRRLMRGPFVPSVIVSRAWALGEWYGGDGGETLFQRRGGSWHFVAGFVGAKGAYDLRKYGVPRMDWCKFGIYARCR